MAENILVVPSEHVESLGISSGFRPAEKSLFDRLLAAGEYQLRGDELENNPAFKQIIPYIVIVAREPGTGRWLVFAYRRTPKGGESRLHGKRSVGIGGHVNALDGSGGALASYDAGLARELLEEVELPAGTKTDTEFVGTILDLGTEVGRVHLGMVEVLLLDSPSAKTKEEDHADDGFYPLSELMGDIDNFETWSQFLLQNLPIPAAAV